MKLIPRCLPGNVLQLTPEEQRYFLWTKMTPELKRENRSNRAKAYLLSAPSVENLWEAFQTYIGNRDPENPNLNTGEVPNPGMRSSTQIVQGVLKAKLIVQKAKTVAERAAKISDKVFNRQYQRAISSGNSKRVLAVRDLHFKGKTGNSQPQVTYHGQTSSNLNLVKQGYNPYSDKRVSGYNSTTSEDVAHTYNFDDDAPTFSLYTYLKNPYIKDAKGSIGSKTITDRSYHENVLRGNNDGSIIQNIYDVGFRRNKLNGASGKSDVIITSPGRAKLRDAVTYDNNGNIIPISLRDNFSIFDIRYKKGGKL